MDFLTSCETRKCSAINFITVNVSVGSNASDGYCRKLEH